MSGRAVLSLAPSGRVRSAVSVSSGLAEKDMSGSAARVTHLPPLCDRAYRRNRDVSVTEVRRTVARFVHRRPRSRRALEADP